MQQPPIPEGTPFFCQICHGHPPDNHFDWCPIKTGEPQLGYALATRWLRETLRRALPEIDALPNPG